MTEVLAIQQMNNFVKKLYDEENENEISLYEEESEKYNVKYDSVVITVDLYHQLIIEPFEEDLSLCMYVSESMGNEDEVVEYRLFWANAVYPEHIREILKANRPETIVAHFKGEETDFDQCFGDDFECLYDTDSEEEERAKDRVSPPKKRLEARRLASKPVIKKRGRPRKI